MKRLLIITMFFCFIVSFWAIPDFNDVYAETDPLSVCQSSKIREAGYTHFCLLKCMSKWIKNPARDPDRKKMTQCLERANKIFIRKWERAEKIAARKGVDCKGTASLESVLSQNSTDAFNMVDMIGEIKLCFNNDNCEHTDLYCSKSVGLCHAIGICTDKPTICPDIWEPVCGCDNNTYGNACYAAYTGVSVKHEGECAVVQICQSNNVCGQFDLYCQKAEGDCTGTGTCVEKPEICFELWAPVCGCDNKTYANACYAAQIGVNVKHNGACSPP